ncbi:integrase catalytic domain-containing protein [Bradyrhizobium japonicum]|uniref:integrase catalytic domain-containing protein n=1 Tax=Bradyrhizobium japonicum TaxID=375 RepID=UPI0027147C88|nr:transposase family protein [Bradyrhizobium japonicum]WLB18847.1 transposase family protein [Bradyrhizobium japonicum]
MLIDVKVAAAGGRRRRVGYYSAIRREVPIRTFNDWANPPPDFCEIDMVAHGGTSVAGSFIQTLTMVDIATGWTECLPLVTRDGSLVVEAMTRAQGLFPWVICGADFDNDSAFMNDVVVPWCRAHEIEVTRSRAYKKNDQAFVEQKNGAVVRRLVGYGRFDGVETARVMATSLRRGAPAGELLTAVIQAQREAPTRVPRSSNAIIRLPHHTKVHWGTRNSHQRSSAVCARRIGLSIPYNCLPRSVRRRKSSPVPAFPSASASRMCCVRGCSVASDERCANVLVPLQ